MLSLGTKTIHDYGKSMYGGWYANWFDSENGNYDGCRVNTLKELCEKLQINRNELIKNVRRFDN